MLSFEDVLKEFDIFFCKRHPIQKFFLAAGGMFGFLMRATLSTSMQSCAVLRKSYMTHWKMILPLKKRFKIHNETDYEKIIV